MNCLTDSEVTAWLRQHFITTDPYGHPAEASDHYLQFRAPTAHRVLDAFARHYYQRILPDTESLLHITDWALYTPSEMLTITAIRSTHHEHRWLIDAPGHLFLPTAETETGIALFSLTASYGWSSYLYSPLHRSTLYNWEGDIFDFWADSKSQLAEMRSILREFKLEEIHAPQ